MCSICPERWNWMCRTGAITALRVTTGGSVQVGVVDTQVSISNSLTSKPTLSADDCTVRTQCWKSCDRITEIERPRFSERKPGDIL